MVSVHDERRVLAMSDTKKTARKTPARGTSTETLTAEERAAMKEHVQELRASARRGGTAAEKAAADAEAQTAKIAEFNDTDRELAERVQAILTANAPDVDIGHVDDVVADQPGDGSGRDAPLHPLRQDAEVLAPQHRRRSVLGRSRG